MNAPVPASGPTSGPSVDATALLFQLRGITVSYDKNEPILNGLDMNARADGVYGLLGLNGAGKSTLTSMVFGLVPYSGEIGIVGHPWSVISLDRTSASINGPAFYLQLSATDDLKIHTHLTDMDKSRIAEALDLVGLHAGNKHTRASSTGMKVRLSLAMAPLIGLDTVLLDEPTNGLDPETTVSLRISLRNFATSDKAVVVSSHQLGEIEKSVDHLGVPAGGRLTYEDLLTNFTAPGQSLEQAFFTAVGIAR